MKSLICCLAIFAAICFAGSGRPVQKKTYDEAFNDAKASGKRLMIVFSRSRCMPCNELKAAIEGKHPEIKYVANTYEVLIYKADMISDLPPKVQQIYRDCGVRRFPTTVSIDPETGKYVKTFVGYDRQKWRAAFAY